MYLFDGYSSYSTIFVTTTVHGFCIFVAVVLFSIVNSNIGSFISISTLFIANKIISSIVLVPSQMTCFIVTVSVTSGLLTS